jgi:hypothetical protein
MAITSLNPGVGPTNADIATAVAAPSAATIAAAVAAPSAATIASAVAAPSSATIATAVAAAVPTTAGITTIVQANAGSPFGGTWTNLGYVSGNGVSSVTFTGLSSYKYLRLYMARVNVATSGGEWYIRINGDSTATAYVQDYYNFSGYTALNPAFDGPTGQFNLGTASANNSNFTGLFEFSESNGSTYKFGKASYHYYDGSYSNRRESNLFWANTSAISSITFTHPSYNMSNASGRGFYLMGAN